jgi:hypothetical protein
MSTAGPRRGCGAWAASAVESAMQIPKLKLSRIDLMGRDDTSSDRAGRGALVAVDYLTAAIGRSGEDPVSLAVTVWRLRDPSGRQAACIVAERDQRWQLVVQRGREMLIAERHSTDDSALARANEIWQTYRELGWTEPTH